MQVDLQTTMAERPCAVMCEEETCPSIIFSHHDQKASRHHKVLASFALFIAIIILMWYARFSLRDSLFYGIDIPMCISSLIFLLPCSIHIRHSEILEASFYILVTITSIFSDAVLPLDMISTNLDRVVASSALLIVLRFTFRIRPHPTHKALSMLGVFLSIYFLLQGRQFPLDSNSYRFNHIVWHICLTATGLWSACYRPGCRRSSFKLQ